MKKYFLFCSLILVLFLAALIIHSCGQTAKEVDISTGDPWIIFVSKRDGQYELYKMKTDGSEQTRLTQGGLIFATGPLTAEVLDPAISPNGTKIAYVSNKDGLPNDTYELYVSNLDGSGLIRLTNNSSNEHHPTWSSDGNWIAFDRYPSPPYGEEVIFKIRSDGSGGETLLSAGPGPGAMEHYADWSHDGTKIAFTSTRTNGDDDEIYIMNPDGSSQEVAISSLETWIVNQPRWSPDGSKILFRVIGPIGSPNWASNLYVASAPSYTTWTQLTTYEYPVDHWHADWSEDGKKIIFVSDRDVDEVGQIYIMNADGSNQRRLTNTSTNIYPVWKKP